MASFRDAFKDVKKHSAEDGKKITRLDPKYKSMDKKKNKNTAKRNRKEEGNG